MKGECLRRNEVLTEQTTKWVDEVVPTSVVQRIEVHSVFSHHCKPLSATEMAKTASLRQAFFPQLPNDLKFYRRRHTAESIHPTIGMSCHRYAKYDSGKVDFECTDY